MTKLLTLAQLAFGEGQSPSPRSPPKERHASSPQKERHASSPPKECHASNAKQDVSFLKIARNLFQGSKKQKRSKSFSSNPITVSGGGGGQPLRNTESTKDAPAQPVLPLGASIRRKDSTSTKDAPVVANEELPCLLGRTSALTGDIPKHSRKSFRDFAKIQEDPRKMPAPCPAGWGRLVAPQPARFDAGAVLKLGYKKGDERSRRKAAIDRSSSCPVGLRSQVTRNDIAMLAENGAFGKRRSV